MDTRPSCPTLLALPPWSSASPSRLQSVYSDILRQKESNPDSYQANIRWWHKALESLARSGIQQEKSTFVISVGPVLMTLLRVQGVGKPLALPTVINELRAQQVLHPKLAFLTQRKSIYDPSPLTGRIAAYALSTFWWSLEQLGVAGEDGLNSTAQDHMDASWWGDYVVVPMVASAADALIAKHPHDHCLTSVLYSVDELKDQIYSVLGAADGLLDDDADILLKFLQRNRSAIVMDGEVVKFTNLDAGIGKITVVDRGVLELKTSVRHLRAQVFQLQRTMDEYTSKACDSLQQNQKQAALSYLRVRKHIEQLLHKRLESLETLQAGLIDVEDALGNRQLMKAYQASTATLQSVLSYPSSHDKSVAKILGALQEATKNAKELEGLIRVGWSSAPEGRVEMHEFEAEINAELETLAALEEDIDTVAERLENLSLKPPTEKPQMPELEGATSRLLYGSASKVKGLGTTRPVALEG
ncbi:hypothetical protein FB45DRAFT_732022 [Roridomyces roridus]|uniref:Charged multivesicular body protein 7 n=1 Tax=Roridomyces roridus TaxID=1738132 RepID=A0AAD7FYX6_9AGAR|nr:hypothetical protein FB45DRAFT_732022 [Roridomyces roridus]